ncbi:MAG: heavy metal translocating P-type ATPase [Bacillota bacterium]
MTVSTELTRTVLKLQGLTCADCARQLEASLSRLSGVQEARVNFGASLVSVLHVGDAGRIMQAIGQAGYAASSPAAAPADGDRALAWAHTRAAALSGAALLSAWILAAAGAPAVVPVSLRALAIVIGGRAIAFKAFHALRRGALDMNVLMTVAVAGAILIGEWAEGAVVAFLFSASAALEAFTVARTRASIRGLMDLTPAQALVRHGDAEILVSAEAVVPGDMVIVKPGERLPVDGLVTSGRSAVNQAPVTGESIPAEVGPGSRVYAGTVNGSGALEVRATRRHEDTTLARIIHLVEEAQGQRTPTQSFIDRFASVYTPAVMGLALAVSVVPPLLGQAWQPWFYRGLSLLVVACPCALVIATPAAMVAAIGNAARRGVLVKGGLQLERLAEVKAVAFDKTGTLTAGSPEITDVVPSGWLEPAELLAITAAVESRSEHALAAAVMRAAAERGIVAPPVTSFTALPGRGAEAQVDGVTFTAGSPRWFQERDLDLRGVEAALERLAAEGKTVIVIGGPDGVLGLIAARDSLRLGAARAWAGLRRLGVGHLALLTGDTEATARAAAQALGADEYMAELLPQDKVLGVRALSREHGAVAMVGDGINDAPALAAADVGIAMGVAGSDAALETADIALMSDDLSALPYAVALARATRRVITQNIAFSLAAKALALALIFPGILTLWMAILADMGTSVAVTLNSMRLIAHNRGKAGGPTEARVG